MEIDIEKVKVQRWAFCPRCKGIGCSECQGRGTVIELVLLSEIPDRQRRVYIAAQKDFIQEWRQNPYQANLSAAAKKRWQDPGYRDKQIATHTGKHPTAEHRAKISAALTRRHNKKA